MGGYIYKYINNDSGDIVYVGKSNNQFTLINRIRTHANQSTWSLNTRVEYAAVPPDIDLYRAETAAINYYYIEGRTQNINQVGGLSQDEARDLMREMRLKWRPIDINHLLSDEDLPRPGGIVVQFEQGLLVGIYIITQIVYTSDGVVYKLFSTDYCRYPVNGLTYDELMSSTKYELWTPELFRQMARKYGWDDVDY